MLSTRRDSGVVISLPHHLAHTLKIVSSLARLAAAFSAGVRHHRYFGGENVNLILAGYEPI